MKQKKALVISIVLAVVSLVCQVAAVFCQLSALPVSTIISSVAGTAIGAVVSLALVLGVVAGVALDKRPVGLVCAIIGVLKQFVSMASYFINYGKFLEPLDLAIYAISNVLPLVLWVAWVVHFAGKQSKGGLVMGVSVLSLMITLFANVFTVLGMVTLALQNSNMYVSLLGRSVLSLVSSLCVSVMHLLAAVSVAKAATAKPAVSKLYQLPEMTETLSPEAAETVATLERFAQLYQKGMITAEQFESKKTELLAKL